MTDVIVYDSHCRTIIAIILIIFAIVFYHNDLYLLMYFTAMTNVLRITSYNCKNIKSSIENARQLFDVNDIVFLQETWLTHDEVFEYRFLC